MPIARFHLSLPPEELEKLYQGVQSCQAVSTQGLRIQFPASALRPFITHVGVIGYFELHYSDQGKFQRLIQLAAKN